MRDLINSAFGQLVKFSGDRSFPFLAIFSHHFMKNVILPAF